MQKSDSQWEISTSQLHMYFNESIIVRGTDGLWLDTAELASGEGCLSFEVRGMNDANITIRCEPQVDASDVPDTMHMGSTVEGNVLPASRVPTLPLTVVLGSHRNTKLKLCGGFDCHVLRHDLTRARLDPRQFKSFWINFTNDTLSLGCGPRGCSCLLQHTVSIPASRLYIGFFSLDCPVAFRNVILSAPIDRHSLSPLLLSPSQPVHLTDMCLSALASCISVENVCEALLVLERTWNASYPVWAQCIALLAPNIADIAVNSPRDIMMLPFEALLHTLTCGFLCAPELLLFCAVESWALGRLLSPADCKLLASGGVPSTPGTCTDCCHESCSAGSLAGAVTECHREDAVRLTVPSHDAVQCLQYIRFPLLTADELERAAGSPLWGLVTGAQRLLDELQVCADEMHSGHAACQGDSGSSGGSELSGGAVCSDACDAHPQDSGAGVGCDVPANLPGSADAGLHLSFSKVREPRVVQQHELWRRWKHQRRRPANVSVELRMDYPGDHNGLVRYLGSNRGRQKHFLNPHLSGMISVSSSSPFSPQSDASKLLSQAFHSFLCAHANMTSAAFWQLDFRPRKLVCLQYVFGVNQSTGFPRSWKLQGSNDGSEWQDLHQVHRSEVLQREGQLGAWNIQQPVLKFYSCVRLLMMGLSADGGTALNVNYMELYGYLS